MNGENTPVTRAELQQELTALESRLESSLIGRMRDMETALLTAFHSYSRGVSVRFRKIEADVSNIDAAANARLAALEDRIMEVERRLPPIV
ncbi:MAG: hypothetical protein Q8N47_08790 [Bryobacterales bacterium]|nr:hypothetical protein [Bryobacterales bacterium]